MACAHFCNFLYVCSPFFTGPREVSKRKSENGCRESYEGYDEVGVEWIGGRVIQNGYIERRYVCEKYMTGYGP